MTKSTITIEPITHDLKIYPEFFSAVCTGVKRAELRKNDRDYRVGDTLHLMETPRGSCHQTGEFINVKITHIADVGEWMPGYVLLSVELQERRKADREPYGFTDGDRRGMIYEPQYADRLKEPLPVYRHAQPAPVVLDVMEPTIEAIKRILPTSNPDEYAACIGADMWNACRAAMLNHPEQHLDMVDHSGDVNEKGGDGNSPVTPDGYVMVPKDPTAEMISSGIAAHYERSQIQIHDRPATGPMECAYIAMLAAAPQPQNAPQNIPEIIPDCWCRTCRPVVLNDMRFVVCPDCGNKRCPRANDHRNACTGSNQPGQEGSAYPAAPQEDINALIPLVSRNEREGK
ncbi:DUF3850 domain-containing protein [Klebsiella pneumoniae]